MNVSRVNSRLEINIALLFILLSATLPLLISLSIDKSVYTIFYYITTIISPLGINYILKNISKHITISANIFNLFTFFLFVSFIILAINLDLS